jgi:hypothetical protein
MADWIGKKPTSAKPGCGTMLHAQIDTLSRGTRFLRLRGDHASGGGTATRSRDPQGLIEIKSGFATTPVAKAAARLKSTAPK